MRDQKKKVRYQVLVRHRERLGRKIDQLQQMDQRYFWVRLGVLLCGALVIFLAYQSRQSRMLLYAGLAFLAILSLVVFLNRRVKRSILRFDLSRSYFTNLLARMDLAWDQIPRTQTKPPENDHPFLGDLNLTGLYSIHQLLDIAFSCGGSQLLQEWLLKPIPELDEILKRQATVGEIKSLPGFRSRLALSSSLVTKGDDEPWDGEELIGWLEHHVEAGSLLPILILLSTLAIINITLFVLFTMSLVPALWVITLGVYVGVYLITYRNQKGIFSQAQHLSTTLERFRSVLVFLETYAYKEDSKLRQLCEPFWKAGKKPSVYLREISIMASATSMKSNPVVWLLLNVLVPWDAYFAYRLEQYKLKMRTLLPSWLDTWYELEALNSIANFAYLNPGYTFPQINSDFSDGKALIQSKSLGHPLLPDEVKICNDFNLDKMGEVIVITGSNMSGKSTFLRTVGVNLCLAYTGAPVNAAYLETNLSRLFTCIQVSDSLTDGISYFYAEVRRLKALLDALKKKHDLPLFFLIDEIFRGTNNRERQIGGRAFVQSLIGGYGVGLISTHDLELIILGEELVEVSNYHFREEVTQGRMLFDYKLRPGPSRTTNALQIMQMEGLPVET